MSENDAFGRIDYLNIYNLWRKNGVVDFSVNRQTSNNKWYKKESLPDTFSTFEFLCDLEDAVEIARETKQLPLKFLQHYKINARILNSMLSSIPHVYFLYARELNTVKIGYTTEIQQRVANLQTGYPYALDLAGTIMGGQYIESVLHKKLKNNLISGEWFYVDGMVADVVLAGRTGDIRSVCEAVGYTRLSKALEPCHE